MAKGCVTGSLHGRAPMPARTDDVDVENDCDAWNNRAAGVRLSDVTGDETPQCIDEPVDDGMDG